jgi:hypothetical protein
MNILTASDIVAQLHGAGLTVSLAAADKLSLVPGSRLTDDLRVLIRDNKALLVDWLTAPNNAELQPPEDPADWHDLDVAYQAHHFNCPACIAAGRGARYGLRCGPGSALWRAYTAADWMPESSSFQSVVTPSQWNIASQRTFGRKTSAQPCRIGNIARWRVASLGMRLQVDEVDNPLTITDGERSQLYLSNQETGPRQG